LGSPWDIPRIKFEVKKGETDEKVIRQSHAVNLRNDLVELSSEPVLINNQ
jgi:hypothetical protein